MSDAGKKLHSHISGAKADEPTTLYLIDVDVEPANTLLGLLGSGTFGNDGDSAKKHGYFIFLTRHRHLHNWKSVDANAGQLKSNEFAVQMLKAYGLGHRVYTDTDDDKRLCAQLDRVIASRQEASQKFPDLNFELRAIAVDVARLQELASELSSGPSAVKTQFRDSIASPVDFLRTLSVLYQVGRRRHDKAEREVAQAVAWLRKEDPPSLGGSFLVRAEIERLLGAISRSEEGGGGPGVSTLKSALTDLQAKLRHYEILRDLAEWLASGAFRWAARLIAMRTRPSAKVKPADQTQRDNSQHGRPAANEVNILIVDEILVPSSDPVSTEQSATMSNALLRIADAFEHRARIRFDFVAQEDVWASVHQHLEGGELRVTTLGKGGASVVSVDLSDYDLILVEVEYRRQYHGPKIVQKLSAYFERRLQSNRAQLFPGILVLSRTANFTHIQECLNLGASDYVRKERLHELPARAVDARITHSWAEPEGRRSNFRSLYALPTHKIVKLQGMRLEDLVLGYRPTAKCDSPREDPIDRDWLESLPKADLHSHIGTYIDLPTIEALAFNTVGHLFDRRWTDHKGNEQSGPRLQANLQEIVDRVCELVIVAGVIHSELTGDSQYSAAQSLALAKRCFANGARGEVSMPREDVLGEVIRWLARGDRQIETFEVSSLVVAAVCIVGGVDTTNRADDPLTRVRKRWNYLDDLGAWSTAVRTSASTSPFPKWCDAFVSDAEKQCRFIIERNWGRSLTHSRRRRDDTSGTEFWKTWAEHVSARIGCAFEYLSDCLERVRVSLAATHAHRFDVSRLGSMWPRFKDITLAQALSTGDSGTSGQRSRVCPSLEALVANPEAVDASEQTLMRYLWGTELLGAEHLQYPENLLLATKSVVDQAVAENVLYTELRCETIGYTQGGMSAVDATDLLAAGLTLAAVYRGASKQKFSTPGKHTWTRVNILLGAKRHKSEEKCREIVSLLTHYLQRGESEKLESQGAPEWWKPSRIVGFDLSGDESKRHEKPAELVRPLFKYSSPITIHAGEAATAENIWNAVYEYGAQRIGHGLRLRENRRLLQYCVTEGICMEFCPISNKFTNGFQDAPSREAYNGKWREHYPLRYYLEEGLDVCISTDNRQLHRNKTLTDDYMCAARMVGGLTRWEVLKIVKAGFKHAFLPKREIEMLLTAVEDRVYDLMTES